MLSSRVPAPPRLAAATVSNNSYVGLQVAGRDHKIDLGLALSGVPLCLVSRAATTFPLAALSNALTPAAKRLDLRRQVMIWNAGLRGAIAYSLAVKMGDDAGGQYFEFSTIIVVLVTTIGLGATTGPMLELLKLAGISAPAEDSGKEEDGAELSSQVGSDGLSEGGPGAGSEAGHTSKPRPGAADGAEATQTSPAAVRLDNDDAAMLASAAEASPSLARLGRQSEPAPPAGGAQWLATPSQRRHHNGHHNPPGSASGGGQRSVLGRVSDGLTHVWRTLDAKIMVPGASCDHLPAIPVLVRFYPPHLTPPPPPLSLAPASLHARAEGGP